MTFNQSFQCGNITIECKLNNTPNFMNVDSYVRTTIEIMYTCMIYLYDHNYNVGRTIRPVLEVHFCTHFLNRRALFKKKEKSNMKTILDPTQRTCPQRTCR